MNCTPARRTAAVPGEAAAPEADAPEIQPVESVAAFDGLISIGTASRSACDLPHRRQRSPAAPNTWDLPRCADTTAASLVTLLHVVNQVTVYKDQVDDSVSCSQGAEGKRSFRSIHVVAKFIAAMRFTSGSAEEREVERLLQTIESLCGYLRLLIARD